MLSGPEETELELEDAVGILSISSCSRCSPDGRWGGTSASTLLPMAVCTSGIMYGLRKLYDGVGGESRGRGGGVSARGVREHNGVTIAKLRKLDQGSKQPVQSRSGTLDKSEEGRGTCRVE